MERNQKIQEYLSKLSATPETNYSLWKATKRLKQIHTADTSPADQEAEREPETKNKRQKSLLNISLRFLSLYQGRLYKRKSISYSLTILFLQHRIPLRVPLLSMKWKL